MKEIIPSCRTIWIVTDAVIQKPYNLSFFYIAHF